MNFIVASFHNISHINPPEADKTLDYAAKPFNATIVKMA
jgi:hypothetical protein